MSEFESNYEGSGYTEPWVSYTTETGATETVKTFTSNIPPDYHGYVSAFTGVFEYVGDYYAPYYDPSQGGDVYDLEWATMYYPVYTNGKKYVTTQNNNNEQPTRTFPPYTVEMVEVNPVEKHPGFINGNLGILNRHEITAVTMEEKAIPQVAYNKNAIYLTWDGVSTVTVGSGSEAKEEPLYAIDQNKSHGKVERASVYVNGEYAYTLPDFLNSYTVYNARNYGDNINFGLGANGYVYHYDRWERLV